MKKQKRLMSLVLSLIMVVSTITVLPFTANALEPSGQCGENVTYTFDEATGALTISGTGEMYNYRWWNESPFGNNQGIKNVVVSNGVTSISDYAFMYCLNLETINISSTVINIGDNTFCSCENLSGIVIPKGVKYIGENAFEGCESIEAITIPSSVLNIDKSAFCNCKGLKSAEILSESIDVGESAFSGCNELVSITLTNGIKNISNFMFDQCEKLTSIDIPGSAGIIGENAFQGCEGLTDVILNDGLKEISEEAFHGCSNLKSINLPNSVTSIGKSAFSFCDNLESVIISSGVTSIEENTFFGCGKIEEINIPEGVVSVGSGAFSDCNHIMRITIPKTVNSIGDNAFFNCWNLEDVYYSGSKNEWNKVSIGANNECLTGATIHYSDEDEPHVHDHKLTKTEAATCGKDGRETYVCSCGDIKYKTINATGKHTEVIDSAVPATFKKAGKTAGKHCSVCGKVLTAQKTVAKLGTPKMSKVKAGKKAFTATWTKANGVDGYQVQYSLKKNFKGAKTKKLNKTKLTVKNLKAKKTYYVRVRAYKKINGKMQYSNWSSKQVKVK